MNKTQVDKIVASDGVVAAGGKLGVAAILYTYRCTIACRHCCFGCSAARPDVKMTTPQGVRHLHDLHAMGRVIHIAGGECMMYWPQLQELIVAAQAEGVAPHFLESNCSFAVSDEIVRERLEFVRRHGVVGMLFSADPFHQAFVPPEHFLRARRIARELFGPANVWASGASDDDIRNLPAIAADEEALRQRVLKSPPRLVGTAALFAPWFEQHPLDQLPPGHGWRFPHTGADCALEFDAEKIWELHIDPYDNIQTNCGVILGHAGSMPLTELLRRGPGNANFVATLLATGGPVALAAYARDRHGWTPPTAAASKCHLCYQARGFLRRFYPEILGPAEVY